MRRRQVLALGLAAALGACNFRPMLLAKGADDEPVRAELAAIELRGLGDGRLGYLVRNALLDELNPQSLPVPARYVLDVRVRSRARALGIQLDSTITRYNLSVYAAFQLREKASDDILVSSTLERISSYNVSREPYADLVASHTAERRAADLVGTDISMLLGAYFARGEPLT
ncbi:MAG: LPS assembly lipoprotein LptE [Geminicoccaceae bacterium]